MVKVSYCDYRSILVINGLGKIRKLYVPFKVKCIQNAGTISVNASVYVEEVGTTSKDELVYFIAGVAYYHSSFRIEAKF